MDLRTPRDLNCKDQGCRNPWEKEVEVSDDIIPTSYVGRSSHGVFGRSVEILDRLHEVTTTALHLQVSSSPPPHPSCADNATADSIEARFPPT
jgi:hypothetical protein